LLYVQYIEYVTSYNLQCRKSNIKRPSQDALNITLHIWPSATGQSSASFLPNAVEGLYTIRTQLLCIFTQLIFLPRPRHMHYSTEWCLIYFFSSLSQFLRRVSACTHTLTHTHNSIKHTTSVVCHSGRVSKVTVRILYTYYIPPSFVFHFIILFFDPRL